jgi:hypothetical protein
MHRYHGPAFACSRSRPAAATLLLRACATVPKGPCARARRPTAPTAPCAPNSLTSRSGGRYPVPLWAVAASSWPRQMLCRNAECSVGRFLPTQTADAGRRAQTTDHRRTVLCCTATLPRIHFSCKIMARNVRTICSTLSLFL